MLNRILDSDLDLDRLKIIVNNCELILLLSYDSKPFRMIQYESKWFTMIQYGPGPYRMVQNDSEWFRVIPHLFIPHKMLNLWMSDRAV